MTAIKEYFKSQKITPYQVEQRTGVSHQTIYKASTKEVDRATVKVLRAIATTTGIDIGKLIHILDELEKD